MMTEEQRLKRNTYAREWNSRNREKVRASKKASNAKRARDRRAWQKEYYQRTKAERATYAKKWRAENADAINQDKKDYYQNNKLQWSLRCKLWREANADALNEKAYRKTIAGMKPLEGHLYILKFDKYIKIGYAVNFERRKKEYTLHNPLPMETIFCRWLLDANIQERHMRWRLRDYKHQGHDWFVDVPDAELLNLGNWS